MFKLKRSELLKGNKFAFFKTRCRLNVKKFFNHRIVDIWNKWPDIVLF